MARLIFLLLFTYTGAIFASPFWGDTSSQPVETAPTSLRPGQFIWKGDAVPSGPIVVIVSLSEQRAYVYRNGIRIGVSSASTGKPGHGTPTGVFNVLQKDKNHHSKTYNNAPMPFTERLTWDGIALHAGGLPGYPSSHGCVHLPTEFARKLFEVSPMGMTVVIANGHQSPEDIVHPSAISPVNAKTGAGAKIPRLSAKEKYRWHPEASESGPMSIIMSGQDKRILVYRNGIEIGRARLAIDNPQQPLGTHAYVMKEGAGSGTSPILKGAPAHLWTSIGIPGHAFEDGKLLDRSGLDRISMPPEFAKALYDSLEPGTTLFMTDAPVLEQQTTGVALNIINSDDPRVN